MAKTTPQALTACSSTLQTQLAFYADQHNKDLVQVDGGWLAKNRPTQRGPMTTMDGDVASII